MLHTETRTETVEEFQKSQLVRLFDVFFIGPITIYAGVKGNFHPAVKTALVLVGIGTICYNAKNYIVNVKRNPI